MFQQDYILRQVQQLIQVLARVLELRTTSLLDEARDEIHNALKHIFDRSPMEISQLSDDQLIELCSSDSMLQAELALAFADLLKQEGMLCNEEGRDADARRYWKKTRVLYEAVLKKSDTIPLDVYDKINTLIDLIDSDEPTD
jgi:hypothetical protein